MKTMLTGVRPSGRLTLGNLLGAIKNFVEMQKDYDRNIIFIADLHGITSPKDPTFIHNAIEECVNLYLACGVDPKNTIIFKQSDMDEHCVLGFLLAFQTKMGELSRMTQFKLKSAEQGGENKEGVDCGLFVYPVLMAADILLYDTTIVPVGLDQKQHLELTRDLGERFNKRYGKTFEIPDCFVGKIGNKILSLTDPTRKMNKSDDINDKGTIFLLDDVKVSRKKIMGAVTDSLNVVKFDEEKQQGVSNLISIYSATTGKSIKDIEMQFAGKGYGDFKKEVANAVCELLTDIQKKYDFYQNNKEIRSEILKNGAKRAKEIASEKCRLAKKNLGLDI